MSCSKISVSLLASNPSFSPSLTIRTLIKAHFTAAPLFVADKQRFSITHSGSYIDTQVTVLDTLSADSGDGEHIFFVVSKDTVIEFDGASGTAEPLLMAGIPAGYEQEAHACVNYIELGLGVDPPTGRAFAPSSATVPASLSRPPRGLLVHGAPGVGKSRFVNHLVKSSRFSRCAVISIGSEILLKK